MNAIHETETTYNVDFVCSIGHTHIHVCARARTPTLGVPDKWSKYDLSGTGVRELVHLSSETYEQFGPATIKLLDMVAQTVAGCFIPSPRAPFWSTPSAGSAGGSGLAVRECASAPLSAWLLSHAALRGLQQPTVQPLPHTDGYEQSLGTGVWVTAWCEWDVGTAAVGHGVGVSGCAYQPLPTSPPPPLFGALGAAVGSAVRRLRDAGSGGFWGAD